MAAADVKLARMLARPRERLTTHTLAVAQRAQQLARDPVFAPFPALAAALPLAAWLHDSGKLARAFQRGLRTPSQRWRGRHEVLSLAFLSWLPLEAAAWLPISAAVVSHHRDWSLIRDMYPPGSPRADALLDELEPAAVRAWYDWLAEQGVALGPFHPPRAESLHTALDQLDAHLAALRQMPCPDPQRHELLLLRGGLMQADHAGAGGVAIATGLPRQPLRHFVAEPYAYQQRMRAQRSQGVLLMSPTGSGKTEASLAWAFQQPVRRLFYLLPYRASINAMQRRLEQFFQPVGLWHGRATTALYRRFLEENNPGLPASDDSGIAANAARRARAAAQAARLYGVPALALSPYLLLAALYQLKGYEATLANCSGATFIVDEIHAYQPERLAMLVCLLRWLQRQFQARLCIMSATLSPQLIAELATTLNLKPVKAGKALYARFQRHRLRLAEGDLAYHLDTISDQARQGMRVLVTVNTVKRARRIAQELRALGHDVLLLHSRFNGRDRWQRESRLAAMLRQPEGAPVVVSTQVIEVSLDVSFDTLHSDPAPLDALIQRLGRVNRRGERPLADGFIYTQPTGEDDRYPIYDVALVQAALATLRPLHNQPLDEAQISALLGTVYAQVPQWQERYQKQLALCEQWVLGQMNPLESAGNSLEKAFYQQIDEVMVLPLALEDDYLALRTADALAADELLVPLRWWQYKMLEAQRRAWRSEDGELFFVDMPYDAASGLQIEEE
jgi:CRISPR-associated endonuclease/helicase Cas3